MRFLHKAIRYLVVAVTIAAATICCTADDDVWDGEYVRRIFSGRRLTPIEGIWRFPGNGATIAITATSSTTYDIILMDSPKLNAVPGTVIGSAVSTGKKDTYDGTLKSREFGKKGRIGSESVIFTVAPNGRILIKPYSTKHSVSFRRWFYRIFGLNIVSSNTRPKDIDGAIRIYPYTDSDHYPIVL